MSDIPDWLRELASESDEEDSLEDDAQPESDADELTVVEDTAPEVEVSPEEGGGEAEISVSESADEIQPTPREPDDLELMEQLRSQVDSGQEEESESPSPGPSFSLDDVLIGGLEPVQQFVLAVLLFLDILVIGLLFLVILGRISI